MIALENTRWEDFDYTYLDELNGNPMGWLANGYVKADYDGSSRTAYLDPANIDYPPVPEPKAVQGNGVPRETEKEDEPEKAKTGSAVYVEVKPVVAVA